MSTRSSQIITTSSVNNIIGEIPLSPPKLSPVPRLITKDSGNIIAIIPNESREIK